MKPGSRIEIYETRHCMTHGIIRRQATVVNFTTVSYVAGGVTFRCVRPNWHVSLGDAVKRAEYVRDQTVNSLKVRMGRLQKIDFYKKVIDA